MYDRFFRLFFTASAASPMLLCSAVLLLWRNGPHKAAVFIFLTGLLLSFLSPFLLIINGHRLSQDGILPETIKSNSADRKIAVALVMTWAVPVTEMLLHHEMIEFWTIFGILMLFLLSYSDSCIPNVWFFLLGYHCYEINAENGIGMYYLLSRRTQISDPDCSLRIAAVFGNLWIETGCVSGK